MRRTQGNSSKSDEAEMATFHLRRMLGPAAAAFMLTAVVQPTVSFSQNDLSTLADRERELVEAIELGERQNGPYSEQLLAPLTALSLHYEEIEDYTATDATIARVLQVIRANYGLYSLEQAPTIRRLMRHEEERGNAAAAWDLERELLRLAERHLDDPRTAQILRDSADKRLDILRGYDAGEYRPEIVLGCYYLDTVPVSDLRKRGSRPLSTYQPAENQNTCASGSRRQAKQSLLKEARALYAGSIDIIVDNQGYTGDELPEFLLGLVRTSYRYGDYVLGQVSIRHLIAYEAENSQEWLPRAEMRVLGADWDLVYSSSFGTKFRDAALTAYQEAYDLLEEHSVPRASIDEIFSPGIPVALPTFASKALISEESPGTTGYVDITFVVAADGRAEDIEVVGATENLKRSDARDIVNKIKQRRFRPMITDGQLADSAPQTVRYYFTD
jgi:hypothetical protein